MMLRDVHVGDACTLFQPGHGYQVMMLMHGEKLDLVQRVSGDTWCFASCLNATLMPVEAFEEELANSSIKKEKLRP